MAAQSDAQQDQQQDEQAQQTPPDRAGDDADQQDTAEAPEEYLDRSKLDFDPDDGLYSGTAVDGSTEIPGPHERDDENGSKHNDSADSAGAATDDESSGVDDGDGEQADRSGEQDDDGDDDADDDAEGTTSQT